MEQQAIEPAPRKKLSYKIMSTVGIALSVVIISLSYLFLRDTLSEPWGNIDPMLFLTLTIPFTGLSSDKAFQHRWMKISVIIVWLIMLAVCIHHVLYAFSLVPSIGILTWVLATLAFFFYIIMMLASPTLQQPPKKPLTKKRVTLLVCAIVLGIALWVALMEMLIRLVL